LVEPAAAGVVFEAKGMKKIRGKPAYGIEVKRDKKPSLKVFISADDFMWVRSEFGEATIQKMIGKFTNASVSHGEDTTNVDFYCDTCDLRDVDGVKLPSQFAPTVTWPVLNDRLAGEIKGTITEYRHNVPIDPTMFQRSGIIVEKRPIPGWRSRWGRLQFPYPSCAQSSARCY
jgi:hypothetical protein